MAVLKFPAAAVQKLVDHALASTKHKLTFGERLEIYGDEKGLEVQPDEESKGKPALWLVKDDGIYLMSNGTPGLRNDADSTASRNVVVYAKGYDPTKDGDVWQKCRAAVGGDDFAELVPLSMVEAPLQRGAAEIVVHMTQTSLSVEMPPPVVSFEEAAKEMSLLLAKHAPGFVFVGTKVGARKERVMVSKAPWEEAYRARLAKTYKSFLILNNEPPAVAVAAYARAVGLTIKKS